MVERAKLLVIGGTGFIGHHLVSVALRKGWDVISLSAHHPRPIRHVKNAQYLVGDFRDSERLRELLNNQRFDYVVNLGGYIGHALFHNGGRRYIDDHFLSLIDLLEILPKDGLKAFVQIGSSDEYGAATAPQVESLRELPISPYSLGKVSATHLFQMLHRTENFPSVVLRLFLVYGPGQDPQRFLPQVISSCLVGETFPVSAGEQMRDFCHVGDVAAAILAALETPKALGEVINIGSGEPVTIRAVVEMVRALIGSGNPEFGKIQYRPGENMCLYPDTEKAATILGWKREYSLADGINNTIAWYRAQRELICGRKS